MKEDKLFPTTRNEERNRLLFSDNKREQRNKDSVSLYWKILIIDDEQDIHTVTSLVLKDYIYQKKGLQIFNASSATAAKKILEKEKDIAVIFLDVVMETPHSGLDLVKYIREDLENA
ncbi:MAG: response regulator, partial [Spirochaetota bacterium]